MFDPLLDDLVTEPISDQGSFPDLGNTIQIDGLDTDSSVSLEDLYIAEEGLLEEDIEEEYSEELSQESKSELESIREKLISGGYTELTDKSITQLGLLIDILAEESTTEDLRENILGSLDALDDAITSSSAMNVDAPSNNNIAIKMPAPELGRSLPSALQSLVQEACANNNTEILQDKHLVLQRVAERCNLSCANKEEVDKLYSYIDSTLPIIYQAEQNRRREAIQRNSAKQVESYSLFTRQREIRESFTQFNEIHLIKGIKQLNNGYGVICPVCGEMVVINSPLILFTLFGVRANTEFKRGKEHEFMLAGTPVPVCCDCGCASVLPTRMIDYVSEQYVQLAKKQLHDYVYRNMSFSAGRAVTTFTASIDDIYTEVSLLIQKEDANLAPDKVAIIVGSETSLATPNELWVDVSEMEKAAKEFYTRFRDKRALRQVRHTKQQQSVSTVESENAISTSAEQKLGSDSLTYRELAVFISEELNKDYNSLKHQAVFSLVLLCENAKLINQLINVNEICSARGTVYNIAQLPKDTATHSQSQKTAAQVEFTRIFTKQESSLTYEEKCAKLCNFAEETEERLEGLRERQEKFFKVLVDNKDMLARTKILNLHQANRFSVAGFLCNPALLDVLDEVTDRMIINQLSEAFFDKFLLFERLNMITINKAINKSADFVSSRKSAISTFEKSVEKAQDNMSDPLSIKVNYGLVGEAFDILSEGSTEALGTLQEIYNSFRMGNYYRFIKAIALLKEWSSKHVSQAFRQRLQALYAFAEKEIILLGDKKEYEFYLQDFTGDDFQNLDAQGLRALHKLQFNMHVPKRREGEELEEYLQRYNELRAHQLMMQYPHYDYSQKFMQFEEFYPDVLLCGCVSDLAYTDVLKACFMRAIVTIVVEGSSRELGSYLFKLSDDMLFKLMRGKDILKKEYVSQDKFEKCVLACNCNYSTFLDKTLEEYEAKLSLEPIVATTAFSEYFVKFDIVQVLQDILAQSDNEIVTQEELFHNATTEISGDITAFSVRETIINEIYDVIGVDLNKEG